MQDKKKIQELVKKKNFKDLKDVNQYLKQFSREIIETMLENEMTEHLGYEKHDYQSKRTDNARNSFSGKTLKSDFGEIPVQIPRDRKAEFDPIVVAKGQRILEGIEEKIIRMYSHGMTERDIAGFIQDTYGASFSAQTISNIIAKVSSLVNQWLTRPLQKVYAVVFLDATFYNVRVNGVVKNVSIYSMIGIDMEGMKDVLGLWMAETESAKYWLNLLNDLKTREVEDILICAVDNLKGFSEAIKASFPNADIQKCIIHQVRNSLRFVSYKHRKELANDMKAIYKATDEKQAKLALDILSENWDSTYPYISKSWRDNWSELITFFKYPVEIRNVIYTTNAIENYHRSLRKVTKSKTIFPNEAALMRILYLATMNATKKWTSTIQNWGIIYSQLRIIFDKRIDEFK
jgi:putative transposase